MPIPLSAALRLLRNTYDNGTGEEPKNRLRWWMENGVSLNPDLDIQDIATLTRILSGEVIFGESETT